MGSKHTPSPKIWIGIGAIILYLILVIVVLCQTLFLKPRKENELDIIQSMIENMELYQEDIESWGYQVSVITPTREMKNKSWEYYYWHYYRYDHPILVLTNADGGMYSFYFGFDGYSSEISYPTMVKGKYGDYAEVMKAVRLQISQCECYQAPFWEKPHNIGEVPYYDIHTEIDITAVPMDDRVNIWDYFHPFFSYTKYCSNNFVDTMRFDVYKREEKIHAADSNIKKEYSAEQLLGFYRQGLDLQERLFELYNEKNTTGNDRVQRWEKDTSHSSLSPNQRRASDTHLDTPCHKYIHTEDYQIDLYKPQLPESRQHEAVLNAEIIQRKSNQTYYLSLEKTAEPDPCLSISVYTPDINNIQIIKEPSNIFSPYYFDHIMTFDDFNCDGYVDMAFIVYEGTMNVLYQLYVWSPLEEQFLKVACDEPLYAPEVRDGAVVNTGKLGAAELEITYFKWENENTLVKTSSEIISLEETASCA